MFGKQVGHYHRSALKTYLVPGKIPKDLLDGFLPSTTHRYFFKDGRHGLHAILEELKRNNPNPTVALPIWTCSILQSTLEAAGVNILRMDVAPESLKMDIDTICEKQPDAVILVAENGHLYLEEEIQKISSRGIVTILDHCLSLRNFRQIKESNGDYFLFSGGFSKPVSSFGLGIVCCSSPLNTETQFHKRISLKTLILYSLHRLIQSPLLYSLIAKFMKTPQMEHFHQKNGDMVNLRHISVLHSELKQFEKDEPEYQALQERVYATFGLTNPPYLNSKILIPAEKLNSNNRIHFHRQYPWTGSLTGNANFPGMQAIRTNFVSLAINKTCLVNADNFIASLAKSVRK